MDRNFGIPRHNRYSQFGKVCTTAGDLSFDSVLWKRIYILNYGTTLPTAFDFGAHWRSIVLLIKGSEKHNNIKAIKEKLHTLHDKLQETEKDNEKGLKTIQNLQYMINHLSSSGSDSQVTPLEEKIFRNTLKKKMVSSSSGLIEANNPRGRSVMLQSVRRAKVPSTSASARTLRERSKSQENIYYNKSV